MKYPGEGVNTLAMPPFPSGIPPDMPMMSADQPSLPLIPPPTPDYIQSLLGSQNPPFSPFDAMGPNPEIAQPEPGPTFLDVPPPPPDEDFIAAVWDYLPPLLSHSRQEVKGHEDKWEKWLKLWKDELNLDDWRRWPNKSGIAYDNTRTKLDLTGLDPSKADDTAWESQYVHSPGYMVDQYADRAYPMIFGGPEFFTVLSQDATTLSTDDEYPTNRKMQEYLLRMLIQGKLHARTYENLLIWPLIGTAFAKVYWYEHLVPRWQQSTITGKIYETDEVAFECPIIQNIPPDRILIDPKAPNNDVNQWRFVGYRVEMTYEEVIEAYENGTFDLNRDKFEKDYQSKNGTTEGDEKSSIMVPDDSAPDTEPQDQTTWVDAWEWHAKIPYKGRLRESWGVIITKKGGEKAEDGIQVRCNQAPLLNIGMRPIVCAHFQQYPGPLGLGMFDRQEKILYTISQLVAQFEDNAKLTANCGWEGGPGFIRQMQKQGNKVTPGMIVPRTIGEPAPTQLAPLHFQADAIQNLIQFLQDWSSRRSTVMDSWVGVQGKVTTATGAQIQQQQGQAPATTKTDLFTRDFFEPALNLCLAYVQQLSFDDKTVTFVGADGSPKQAVITEEEMKRGRYTVVATLTHQDSQSLAKLQSIERFIPILQNLGPNLMEEGAAVSFVEMIKRYGDLLGVEGTDRIVKMLSSREQVLMQQVQDLLGRLQGLQEQMQHGNQGPPKENENPQPSSNPEIQPGGQGGPMGETPSDMNQQMLQLQMGNQDNLPEAY